MSRLCRLKTASHGDDGKWAYGEIIKLRQAIESQAAEIAELDALRNDAVLRLDTYKALCGQMAYAMEMHGAPFLHHELRYNEALEAWRAMG